jgi:hypothetical protein
MTELSPQLLERFILSENKQDVLKEVTPHTNLHRFLELFIALNTPGQSTQALEEKFKAFTSQNPPTEHSDTIGLSLMLRKAEEAKADTEKLKVVAKEINDKYLFNNFVYENTGQTEYRDDLNESSNSAPSSRLSPEQLKELSIQHHLDQAYTDRSLSNLKSDFFHLLDIDRFDLKTEFHLVEMILSAHKDLSKVKGIKELITEISKLKGHSFVQNFIWPKLPLRLKEDLMDPVGPFFSSKDMFMGFLNDKFNLDQLTKSTTTGEEKVKTLTAVIDYVSKVPPRYNQIKRGFNQHLLLVQEQLGTVDRTALLAYLRDPYNVHVTWTKEDFNKKVNRARADHKEEDFRTFGCYFKPSDADLIERCLKRVFRTEKSLVEFEEFMEPLKLRELFWQVKLQNGEECPNAKDFFTDAKLDQLFNQKELRFLESNTPFFKSGDKVEVGVSVKNVSRLTVRIFEVNTLNYVMERNDQNYETIDVSGLIPSGEYEHRYTQSPMVVHEERFHFDNIQSCERGVFIVDFIGDEVSSRCVIYKGQLNLIYQGSHGRSCVIRDHNSQLCKGKGTGLYIGDTFFAADPDTGLISIPTNVGSVNRKVVTLHKGFADLCYLATKDPNPKFSATVVFNSEEFIPGNKATFAVEPKLRMYDQPASLSFVSKLSVTVSTTNDQRVVNETAFKDLTVDDNKDVLVDLIFPPKVVSLEVKVEAELKVGKDTTTEKVTVPLCVNRRLGNEIFDLFFQKEQDGQVNLFVLGKNGEPRKNIFVGLEVDVEHGVQKKSFNLVTNEKGCCSIGVVENLQSIEATSGSAKSTYFDVTKVLSPSAYPQTILLIEKEPLSLPLNTESDHVVFYALDHKDNIREEVSRNSYTLANGHLQVKGLEEGGYRLSIGKQDISITVVKEEQQSDCRGLLWTNDGIIAREDKPKLLFTSRKDREDHYELHLTTPRPNLRTRLLTYNYQPNELIRFCDSHHTSVESTRFGQLPFSTFDKRQLKNAFMAQTRLSDELIYVYDRKTKKTFMGNTLEKPGVLLKRVKVGETTETDQVINLGDVKGSQPGYGQSNSFGRNNKMMERMCPKVCCPVIRDQEMIRINEFLGNPGKLTTGIEVTDGVIIVPKTSVSAFAFSYLWVSDGVNDLVLPVAGDSKQPQLKDCTLQQTRKDGHIYAYSREVGYLTANDTKIVPNIANTQIFMITSLKDLFGCYKTLTRNSCIEFAEWEFLYTWASLSPMDKLKKYDKYASHELNLFLFFKDKEFFQEVVRPFLENKKEKGVVDYFLLDRPECCTDLFNVVHASNLNIVEKVLLAVLAKKSHPQFAQSMLSLFRLTSATNKLPTPEYKALFEALLNANSDAITAVETGEEGGIGYASNMMVQNFAVLQRPEVQSRMMQVERASLGLFSTSNAMPRAECLDMIQNNDDGMECYYEQNKAIYEEPKDIFEKAQGTIEYKERQYFTDSFGSDVNDFWADVMSHLLANDSNANFGSKHFLKSVVTLPEFVFALALIDLPFEKSKYESSVANDTLTLKATSNMFVLSKEIIERKGEVMDLEVLCSQKLFDPEDPVVYDDQDPEVFYDKPVEEFVINKVYAIRVVVTNSTTTQLKLNLIVEIPSGSIPTDSMDSLHIKDLTIDQFRSEVVELRFYFPKAGTFDLFPAAAVSNGKIVSSARKMSQLVVKAEKSLKGSKTMSDVLSNGTIDDILDFIKSKNIMNNKIFSFYQVYWLLKNKTFYERLVAICEEKGVYDNVVWSFSIFHGDYQRLRQFLRAQPPHCLVPSLKYLSTPVLHRDNFTVREYYPLINPRAHVLGSSKTNIINDTFKKTYQEFLQYLFQKFRPSPEDWVLLVNYLIAQDQIEKALEVSKLLKLHPDLHPSTLIQHDYQSANLNFVTGYPDFDQAKEICERYLTYPVLSVRNLFVEMVNQLAEFEESGTSGEVQAQKEGELANKAKSQRVASFTSSLEGSRVKLVSSLVGNFVFKFYKVEAEVIFSLSPFNFESNKAFSQVSPFYEATVIADDLNDLAVTHYDIPANLLEENLFIEVRSLSEKIKKSEFMTFMPFKLNCVVTKELGILKCFDQKTNKPVPKVYVKCFTKQSGEVKFYKDGYTDLRGSFDYVSLNSDKVDRIESFAILVTSPEFGA